MRRTAFLGVAIFSFLLGTMVASVHRSVLKHLSDATTIEAFVPPLYRRDSLTPLRVGVFIGVDGVTLSTDGKKSVLYDEAYAERETVVQISPAELRDLVDQLRAYVVLPRTLRRADASPEEYAVYSAVIANMLAGDRVTFDTQSKIKLLVIEDHTSTDLTTGVDSDQDDQYFRRLLPWRKESSTITEPRIKNQSD